jgi:hypothetical protein
MAREITEREGRERLVTMEYVRASHAFLEQRVRGLLPLARPATDESVELRVHHHVGKSFTIRVDARASELQCELGPRQEHAALERTLEDPPCARQGPRVELVAAIVRSAERVDTRRRERQQPANVGRRDEVPGGTHHVRP